MLYAFLRKYTITVSVLALIVAIIGYSVPSLFHGEPNIQWMPAICLVVGLLGFAVSFVTISFIALRWYTGAVGMLFLYLGIITVFNDLAPLYNIVRMILGMLMLVSGFIGFTLLLVSFRMPAQETYAPPTT